MNPWLETIGVILVALFGVFIGKVFSGFRRGYYWTIGYFLSLLLIAVLVAARCTGPLAFEPPFLWISAGRAKFVIFCLAVTMGLTTPLSRLPHKCEKVMTCILMAVVVVWFSVFPFLVPALIQGHLANLKTRIDLNGICYQSTDYTCAPAAAVTALGQLGLPAQEGEIAVLSHSSPVTGTLPGCLSAALEKRYGSEGLECEYRRFDSVEQLRDAGITLAVVRAEFLSDHCVAVIGVSDGLVTLADPVTGRMLMSYEQFEKIWRFSGVVLKRDTAQRI